MSHDVNKTSEALETVYTDLSDFLIIGLTGRTGSGCSTAASILALDRLPLPETGSSHYKENEGRKYRIIKNYVERKWQPFHWLQIRTVLTHYILRINFSEFLHLVSQATKTDLSDVTLKLADFRHDYEVVHKLIKIADNIVEDSLENIDVKRDLEFRFYFRDLREFSNKIRSALQRISAGAYTTIYQHVGDNVRSSGRAESSVFDPAQVFNFPRTIARVIEAARHHSVRNNKKCYIVIDAIRNPYEAAFLREQYAEFYLVSINTDNNSRLDHLRKSHKFTDQQIEDLDKKEYPEKLAGDKRFSSQNIQKCTELADIHMNNPRVDYLGSSELASQLAWYVSLMMHPGLVMPTAMEGCMQIAYSVKKSSGCISRQVGAVVTDATYSVKSVGWNNTPGGQVPCLLRSADHLIKGIDSISYSRYERADEKFGKALKEKFSPKIIALADAKGRNLSFCFKDLQNEIDNEKNQIHTRSLHAEENAFLQIAKFGGQKILGGILFTTASPCELCAKKAYQLGIEKIYYIDPYPGIATTHVLSSGRHQPTMILFRGAIGAAYHRLYQPIMPYKDELEMLLAVPKKEDSKDLRIRKLKEEVAQLKLQLEIAKVIEPGRADFEKSAE